MSDRLSDLEAAIAEARTAIDRAETTVGAALREIRDNRLYKATHKSFGAYCLERWELSRSHAYRLIDQVSVVENLSPTGDSPVAVSAPTERQARELAGLAPDKQREVWTAAVVSAPGGRPTAAHVRAARRRVVGRDLSRRLSLARRLFAEAARSGCIIAAVVTAASCGGGL